MKKEMLILLLIIPLLSASVFINEVELNPQGSDSGNEWVEIFNENEIVLNGWYITDKDNNKFFIVNGSSDKYYVINNLNDLVNNNENVSLFNESGDLIDNINVSDSDDDNKTWQRVPDGTGSFVFKYETKGSTNDVIKVPGDYAKIQDAIGNATPGDTIIVSSGTYSEPIASCDGDLAMFCIDKSIVIKGNSLPVIDGLNQDASAFVFKRSANVSDVVIEKFEIKNFNNSGCCTGGIGSGILAWDAGTSDIVIINNYLHNLGWNGILVGSDDGNVQDNWTIYNNTIDNADYAGIELTNVNKSNIKNNNVTVGSGIAWDFNDSGVGIEIAVRDHGTGVKAGYNVVMNNIIGRDNNTGFDAERAGINILSRAYVSTANASLKNISIMNNSITGINRGIFVTAESRSDGDALVSMIGIKGNTIDANGDGITLYDFVKNGNGNALHNLIEILNNVISDSTGPSSGIHLNPGTNASNIFVHYNNIINNSAYGINNEGFNLLNATFNYWGHCTGPSGNGSGLGDPVSANVLFVPWLGICIENKSETACSFDDKNVTLMANVSGPGLDSVWFSYTINGTNVNKTPTSVLGTNYSLIINKSEIIPGNVTWNVYANDSFGNLFKNGERTFYVHNNTQLAVAPVMPNGANGWYVTEPIFTLISDTIDFLNSYYRWDSTGTIKYNGSFGLENIPNAPPINSSGTLELNWFSEFSCGNESLDNKTFFIDLTNPVIKNLMPENNSLVGHNDVLIKALIDEVYQSNSGVNKSSVMMWVNGNVVNANVSNATNPLDALVSYLTNLSDGTHNITIYAEDNAGRISNLSWSFEVNTTAFIFDLIVNSPSNQNYSEKRIPINVSVNGIVDKITFIDLSELRPREKSLCRKNCDGYGHNKIKLQSFRDGFHNLTFRAIKDDMIVDEENVSFIVDTKKPRIKKTEPKKGFANGTFKVEFDENNPVNVTLFYGNSTRSKSLDIENDCNLDRRYTCVTNVNLSDFDGQEIEYWFNVSDIVNQTDMSRETKLKVDITPPVINFFNYTIDKRRVSFFFNVSEINFDEINYIDYNDRRPRERILCLRLKKGICGKSVIFNVGIHNVSFNVLDEAGNTASIENVNITIFRHDLL
ncbi:hypothetical protein J4221_05130 [Candidatus Pacearchaeota archaeon]|nr:hypothetical protein [Candidatus Pacearchaeota archaeon]